MRSFAALAATLALALVAIPAADAAAPTILSTSVSGVTTTTALLEGEVNPGGVLTHYRFEYGPADCASNPCTAVPAVEGRIAAGSQPVKVEALVAGLTPGTLYHYRLVAKNPAEVVGPDHVLATYGPAQEGLPDGRAYEQASPVDKDGGDAQGAQYMAKASPDGAEIGFGSAFGIPGGQGAQVVPAFLAGRGASDWATRGLLPPFSFGEDARIAGWSPDYSRVYSGVAKLAEPNLEAFVVQSTATGTFTMIAPYVPRGEDNFAGEADNGAVVFFEAKAKLPPTQGGTPNPDAVQGIPNLYVWDRASGEVKLAGLFNQGAPKGSFAGPYDWSLGTNSFNLHEGGGQRSYYLQGMHAITPEGDVYFTAAGTGQLYLRVNPTMPQSPLDGQGHCTKPELACTLQVSASQKTNGNGPKGTDPAGEQPAAFQAATEDGSQVFFTSTEKLTDDANTGPEQPLAAIARAKLNGEVAEDTESEFFPKHAVGITRSGPWLYWADPSKGSIGRIRLNAQEEVEPATEEPDFIVPPPSEGKCEEEIQSGPDKETFKPIKDPIPSEPRYVAIDAGHVYWTNTGLRDEFGVPRDSGGTIGRAALDGSEGLVPGSIEPAFICGADPTKPGEPPVSNPQGIAVNTTHVYWANAAEGSLSHRTIARAAIDGSGAEGTFFRTSAGTIPYGVAVSATHLYFAGDEDPNSYLVRMDLEGNEHEQLFVGAKGLRGLTLDAGHLYWATQGEGGAIGRTNLELENVEDLRNGNAFIDVQGAPNGIALGTSHIFWASNGETSGNPGDDLYRYEPSAGTLADLTPLGPVGTGDGAGVQGVLGASDDGSYIYFAANGVLAAGGSQGDCHGSVRTAQGSCNLYIWHEGQIDFVAALDASGAQSSDSLDWVGTPVEVIAGGKSYPRTAFLGRGGRVLVFRSQEELTAYDNEGVSEFYRYDAAEPGRITCLTCRPGGEAAGGGPDVGAVDFPVTKPPYPVGYASRNLSADGERFFFETPEALVPVDIGGLTGCPAVGQGHFPSCLDTYEWEAAGSGSCHQGGPAYSPIDEGCIYLISTGKSSSPSFFADASEDGSNAFFFTRQPLVGQDQDQLQDVYDARVGGGLAAQNQTPAVPCEGAEGCHGPAQGAPAEAAPATPGFTGPGNVKPKTTKPKKPKPHRHKKHKHKSKNEKHKKHNHGKPPGTKTNARSAR